MRDIFKGLLGSFVVIAVVSCSQVPMGPIDPVVKQSLYGRWEIFDRYGDVEKTLEFFEDGRFELSGRRGSSPYTWGQIRVSGSRFRIWNSGGRYERNCRVKADYTYLVDGDTLILSAVDDPCDERSHLFSELWYPAQ